MKIERELEPNGDLSEGDQLKVGGRICRTIRCPHSGERAIFIGGDQMSLVNIGPVCTTFVRAFNQDPLPNVSIHQADLQLLIDHCCMSALDEAETARVEEIKRNHGIADAKKPCPANELIARAFDDHR